MRPYVIILSSLLQSSSHSLINGTVEACSSDDSLWPGSTQAACPLWLRHQIPTPTAKQQVSIQILKKPKCKPNLAEKELLPLSTEGPDWKVLV
jgi:hypothetical protein